jgi:micrococcal nuclease
MLRWLAFTLIPVILEVLQAHLAFAADFTGPIVAVLDGDTIEVLRNHHAERIRLSGIDCPEKGQSW